MYNNSNFSTKIDQNKVGLFCNCFLSLNSVEQPYLKINLQSSTKLLRTDKCLKPEQIVWISDTNLQICVWNPNFLFRLSYMFLDFRHFCLFKVIWFRRLLYVDEKKRTW